MEAGNIVKFYPTLNCFEVQKNSEKCQNKSMRSSLRLGFFQICLQRVGIVTITKKRQAKLAVKGGSSKRPNENDT